MQRAIFPLTAANAFTTTSSAMPITFHYRLLEAGWSECQLVIDEVNITITASYLFDALPSLLSAICRVVSDVPESTAFFEEEPGEYRWRFYRVGEDRLRVVVLWFDEFGRSQPDEQGRTLCDTTCRLKTFAGAVYSGCKDLLAKHGYDGYRARWKSPFPAAEFEELKHLLKKANA